MIKTSVMIHIGEQSHPRALRPVIHRLTFNDAVMAVNDVGKLSMPPIEAVATTRLSGHQIMLLYELCFMVRCASK